MGMYNILTCSLSCPHCGSETPMDVEFRFGWPNLDRYEIGDTLQWGESRPGDRTRPLADQFTGEGYVECPCCQLDFWVLIALQRNVITDVRRDTSRPGYKSPRSGSVMRFEPASYMRHSSYFSRTTYTSLAHPIEATLTCTSLRRSSTRPRLTAAIDWRSFVCGT